MKSISNVFEARSYLINEADGLTPSKEFMSLITQLQTNRDNKDNVKQKRAGLKKQIIDILDNYFTPITNNILKDSGLKYRIEVLSNVFRITFEDTVFMQFIKIKEKEFGDNFQLELSFSSKRRFSDLFDTDYFDNNQLINGFDEIATLKNLYLKLQDSVKKFDPSEISSLKSDMYPETSSTSNSTTVNTGKLKTQTRDQIISEILEQFKNKEMNFMSMTKKQFEARYKTIKNDVETLSGEYTADQPFLALNINRQIYNSIKDSDIVCPLWWWKGSGNSIIPIKKLKIKSVRKNATLDIIDGGGAGTFFENNDAFSSDGRGFYNEQSNQLFENTKNPQLILSPQIIIKLMSYFSTDMNQYLKAFHAVS